VRVGLSSQLERERYRTQDEISERLRQQRRGSAVDDDRRAAGKPLLEVVDASTGGIALLGNPGSGKTTALRHLALTLAKGHAVRARRVIPIFLPVRDLAIDGRGIEEAAIALLVSFDIGEAKAVFHALLRAGDVAILLDGIDEAERNLQLKLLHELRKLRDEYKKAIVCISGRPYTLNIGLPGFEKWETLPLSLQERLSLVRKWYDEVDPHKGDRLIADCADNPGLLDLGSNPLLLSIVCALYYNDLKIPTEPDELYARTVEGLLGAWDAFRAIARFTPLSDYSVRRRAVLMSWIAATMFDLQRLVFTPRDIEASRVLERFADAMHTSPIPADDLLGSLFNDFGILIERAPGLFSFSHLTLQEYLTAQYIVDNRRELELLKHQRAEEWREVLRLVAKMLPNANLYMAKLTEETDLANEYDLALLNAAWATRPICDRGQIVASMRTIADRAVSAIRPLRASYRLAQDRLVVRLDSDYQSASVTAHTFGHERTRALHELTQKRRGVERRVAVLNNLPLVLALLRLGGVSLHDLRISNVTPFDILMYADRFSGVDIENW
jgi:predicted NACHT family NTPase